MIARNVTPTLGMSLPNPGSGLWTTWPRWGISPTLLTAPQRLNGVACVISGSPVDFETRRDQVRLAVIHNPQHPYTVGLMGAIPSVGDEVERLTQIDGAMPRLTAIPPGCAFNPRCTRVNEVPDGRCRRERPGLLPAGKTDAACWLHARPLNTPSPSQGEGRGGVASFNNPKVPA